MLALKITFILLLAFSNLPVFAQGRPNSAPGVASGLRTYKRSGQLRPGVYVVLNSQNFGPYEADCTRRIKRNWFPPKICIGESSPCQVRFKIKNDGSVEDVQIEQGSGNSLTDSSARKAIQNAAPFRPLPEDWNKTELDVRFTLSYSIFQGGSPMEIAEMDYQKYSAAIAKKIASKWSPTIKDDETVLVSVEVDSDGKVETGFVRSRLSPEIDQSILDVIKKASPFGKPPGERAYGQIEFKFAAP